MKSNVKTFMVALCGVAFGVALNNFAISAVVNNIAVVDIQKVVASSAQVKSLKTEQNKKIQDLSSFVTTAKTKIKKESDTTKKKALEDKYNKELQTKKNTIEKDYTVKLSAIDTSISNTIKQTAVKNNYSLVLAKGVVLYGGTDITNEIVNSVK